MGAFCNTGAAKVSDNECKGVAMACLGGRTEVASREFAHTHEVEELRRGLKGLVASWFDRNANELYFVCPSLFRASRDRTFDLTKCQHYKLVKPAKFDKAKVTSCMRGCAAGGLWEHGSRTDIFMITKHLAPAGQGNFDGIKMTWSVWYEHVGWEAKIAFDFDGKVGVPYPLHKSKNCQPILPEKFHKCRPITP